ncbi:MAG: RIP metalloprotease RseP [bacterium]
MPTSIILVIIFIGVLITFHEFGHLIVAKLAHIPVESFSVGFGPVIIKRRIGETEYRLSIIPLGGYIKMTGEENPEEGGFSQKPLGIRAAVIAAGPISNLILGFVLMVVMYLVFGIKYLPPAIDPLPGSHTESISLLPGDMIVNIAGETIPSFEALEQTLQANAGKEVTIAVKRGNERLILSYPVPESLDIEPFIPPVIDRVRAGSPAEKIGIKHGDRIVAVDGIEVGRWNDFVEIVRNNAGKPISITFQRGDVILSDTITPAIERDQISDEKFGQIGVWVMLPRISLSFPRAFAEALRRTGYITVQTLVIIYKVITRKISTRAIGGPIMVAKIAYEGVAWGSEYFLALWALLSINLFVVNMLPIPVLDGGRILLDLIGGIRRRRLSDKELTWASNIGWLLIALLIAFTIFNDLLRLIQK